MIAIATKFSDFSGIDLINNKCFVDTPYLLILRLLKGIILCTKHPICNRYISQKKDPRK